MDEKKVVGSMSEWSGVLKDFFRQIDDRSISLGEVQALLEHKNPFDRADLISDWQDFYQEVFGVEVDISALKIPKKKRGFNRLIVVAQGMTVQRLYDKCEEMFPCWKWIDESLDKTVQSERTSENGAYAVWFRNRIEADEELRDLSANDLKKRKIAGITLEERLIYELKYFKETGEHLDINNVTICAGSRDSDGDVPNVHLYDGAQMGVNWYHPVCRRANLRSRQAVL